MTSRTSWTKQTRSLRRKRVAKNVETRLSLERLEDRRLLASLSGSAYQLLNERVTANQEDFFVYQDADSAFNHGLPAPYPAGANLTLACVNDPQSADGCSGDPDMLDRDRGTVIQIAHTPPDPTFVGLPFNSPSGYDLTGATQLVFEARSPTVGGVDVLVRAGGAGAFTSKHTPEGDNFVHLSVPLPADLSSVTNLFEISVNQPQPGVVLLDNIRYVPTPDRQAAELSLPLATETFGAQIAANPPFPQDQAARNLTTVYESSLTLLSLLDRGTPQDLAGAQQIAETFLYALDHDVAGGNRIPVASDGSRGLHSGYQAGDIADAPGSTTGAVRLAGLWTGSQYFLVQDGTTGGNNAFAVMALIAAYREFGDVRYLDGAREISRWIVDQLRDDDPTGWGGYYWGFEDGGGPGVGDRPLAQYKSIENCADIFSAFIQLAAVERELGNDAEAAAWTERAYHAGDFVMDMYDPVLGRFNAGTVPVGTAPGPGVDPTGQQMGGDVINVFDLLDSNSFTTLALAQFPMYRNAIDWRRPTDFMLDKFDQTITAGGQDYIGFSLTEFPVADQYHPQPSPDGIAWEFTGQAVVTMQYVDWLYGESNYADEINKYRAELQHAQTSAPFGDGMGLVASTLDGEDEADSPFAPVGHCLTTPFQCIPERVGLAATNWAIYADRSVNIFTPQLPLPQETGQTFVVDDWNNKVTQNDLGFNYFAGNTGTTGPVEGITTAELSPESNGDVGGSLDLSFDFTGQAPEAFAGYFASLFGLTDTLVSLDGSGVEPGVPTPFPDYYLDMQDIYRGDMPFGHRSVELLKFDVNLQSAEDVTLRIELLDEANFDVFTRRTITNTGGSWETTTLPLPAGFDNSVAGAGNPSAFNWNEVNTFTLVIERNNFGDGVHNPDTGQFLVDNIELVDIDGAYPDLDAMEDPVSGQLNALYEEAFLDHVRATSAQYFVDWASTDSRTGGIIQDRSTFADLMTVGGVGFQLTTYVIAAERGYMERIEAAERVDSILSVLRDQPQGPDRVGTIGNEGFFYHFLGIDGLRKQNFDYVDTPEDEALNTVELSTIDTALAVAGAVTAAQYFDADEPVENEIRDLADEIYRRVNWPFMLDDERFADTNQFFLGWKPNETRDDDSGMYGRFKLDDDPQNPQGQYSSKPDNGNEVPATIDFYTDEGLLIALLAMGSPEPNHRLGRDVWDAMIRETDGGSFVKTYPGALFTYEFASVWLDTETLGTDNHQAINGQPALPTNFFNNSRDAVLATRDYAIANPNDRVTWQGGGGLTRWGLSAAEGPYDDYHAYAALPAALATDGGIIAGGGMYAAEAEDGFGDGQIMENRSDASGTRTVWLHDGESRTVMIDVPDAREYEIVVRYSNDNFGPLENVEVSVDGNVVDSFLAEDTGDGGLGWFVFLESDPLGPLMLDPGVHDVTVTVSGGDGWGVEIDKLTLQHGPVLRPLEDGTTTVYGAGSAIQHVPGHAVDSLWESRQLELLHPRFGFADAFNLEIADAVVPPDPGSEILRTTGSWANFTGFSIDHGPMLIAIDNYLHDDLVPSLFMSNAEIRSALSTLFPDFQTVPDDIGMYHGGSFYLDTTGNGTWDKVSGGDTFHDFGIRSLRETGVPVIGDFDGNGTDDLGLYHDGNFYLDATANGIWDTTAGGDTFRDFGIRSLRQTGVPVTGDWDGNGTDDLGLYHGGLFYLDATGNGAWDGVAGGDTFRDFGIRSLRQTGVPVTGDWDGNGTDDPGLYHDGLFYLDATGNGAWDKVSGGDTFRDFGINAIRSTGLPLAGRWPPPPAPLLAAGGPVVPDAAAIDLSDEQLTPILDQAIALWAASGLNQAEVQRLASIDVRIVDLPGARLGEALGTTITVDIDAAGYGWFVDATPWANEEFSDSAAEGLVANPSGLAADRMDLLSAVLHELGHVLGHGDLDDILSDDVMNGWLPAGIRRL